MLKKTTTLFFILTSLLSVAQKSFVGSLEYNVSSIDFLSKDTINGKLFIYARDSLVRINYRFSDGKNQETIHHLGQHKMLSLLDVDGQYFAIQIKDTVKTSRKYIYHKRLVWSNFIELKCREAVVEFPEGSSLLYYYKKIDARYFVGFKNAPGLPVRGQIPTENGIMSFELDKIDRRTPPQGLFMPDKKYKVISLEAFMQWSKQQ